LIGNVIQQHAIDERERLRAEIRAELASEVAKLRDELKVDRQAERGTKWKPVPQTAGSMIA
jgi:hypothetical protein